MLDAAEPKIASPEAVPALIDLFMLEKAAYEIRYEAANRPTWVGIPIAGLHSIATRLLGSEGGDV